LLDKAAVKTLSSR